MPSPQELLLKLHHTLSHYMEQAVVMLPNIAMAIVVLAITVFASRWVQRGTERLVLQLSQNKPISGLLGTVARVGALAVGLFIALGLLNLDKTVTSLLAGVGVVGLALGFAFQDIAANFMSGFLMALRGPFSAGDLVEVAGHRGRIQHITLRATQLETLDGLSVLIPNKDIFQSAIINYTLTSTRRMELSVGTAYGDDMETVRKVVLEALQDVPERLSTRAPELYFEGFGDSSINFKAFVWLAAADEGTYLRARSEAMIAVKRALDAAKLTIPFPIRTLDFGAGVVGGETLQNTPLRIVSE